MGREGDWVEGLKREDSALKNYLAGADTVYIPSTN
jgi:hypothetical protein